jgi:hypothetical protein
MSHTRLSRSAVTFLADEGVDRQIVDRLRLDGHQVAYVAEMSPGAQKTVAAHPNKKLDSNRDLAYNLTRRYLLSYAPHPSGVFDAPRASF